MSILKKRIDNSPTIEHKIIIFLPLLVGHWDQICDGLQQNREQVAQAYFQIWAIEVGIGGENDSSVDFEIFVFLRTLYFFYHLHVISD